MRLHSITFKNFRLFQNETFEFKPLTILTGPNSSGKSTVAKALMLLQENLKAPNYLGRLTFKSGNHRLGNFESILTKGIEEKTVTFDLKFENTSFKRGVNKDSRHLFEDTTFFRVVYVFEQHADVQKENGLLKSYAIYIEEADANEKLILSCKKNEEEDTCVFFADIEWFVDKILYANLFKFTPKLYLIWDKINLSDFDAEITRRKKNINYHLKKELKDIEILVSGADKGSDELIAILERIAEIDKIIGKIDQYDNFHAELVKIIKQEIEIEKKYDDKLNVIKYNIYKIENKENELDKISISELESSESKSELNLLIEKKVGLEMQIESLEKAKDDDLRAIFNKKEDIELKGNSTKEERKLYEEKAKLEFRIDEIKLEEIDKIKKKFKNEQKLVREGEIRTLLYRQVEEASKDYLKSLIKIPFDGRIPSLKDTTIAQYMSNLGWANSIYALTQAKEGIKIIDALPWTDETLFIKKVLQRYIDKDEEKPDKGLFSELIGDGHENQMAQLLIAKIREIIQLFHEPLAFTSISAMRGFQQRIYQTNQPEFHLEEALSTLLTMQYNHATEKLDFIQKWIRIFNIGQEIKAEAIEGDYVRGFIIDVDGNEMNIADKGLGIAQIIPIIIYTADALDTNKLICVEEPGTHLHPDFQAKLVEFVEDGILRNVQFLFETHSEYFIRKLQYQVVHDKQFKPSDILIRYLDRQIDGNKSITVSKEGNLIDESGNVIESFGEGFLDEATKWINKRDNEKELMSSMDIKSIKEFIENGNKVIFCENKNASHFNDLKLPKVKFIPANDKGDVYFKTINYPECFGLIDRDYLSDEEIIALRCRHENLFFLKYYCFENYLYHPANIEELLLPFAGNLIDSILQEKSTIRLNLFSKIPNSRKSYDLLKQSTGLFSDKQFSKGTENVMGYLESEDFEVFYKVFDMKQNCGGIKEKINIDKATLAKTIWFKRQIAEIFGISV